MSPHLTEAHRAAEWSLAQMQEQGMSRDRRGHLGAVCSILYLSPPFKHVYQYNLKSKGQKWRITYLECLILNFLNKNGLHVLTEKTANSQTQ